MTNSRSDGRAPSRASGMGHALAGVAILAVTVAIGCHRAPAPAAAPAPPAGASVPLERQLAALIHAPGLESATWGVLVRSLSNGDVLYAEQPGRLLVPASALKIATLAVAADRLGWDHAYETRLLATGRIDDGVLHGDLIVSGSGDPSIADWEGYATLLFRSWADRLKELRVRVVAGRLIGDDTAFDDEGFGAGWAWDDLSASYAAGVGALQFNQNTVRLAITPAPVSGEPAHVASRPEVGVLSVDNGVTTGLPGSPTDVRVRRLPGRAIVSVSGSVPAGSATVFRNVSVDNPALYFGRAFAGILAEEEIALDGGVVDVDAAGDPVIRLDARAIVVHRSDPLPALAGTMMRASQNLYAETLVKTLGQTAGAGTFDAGLEVVRGSLDAWGIPAAGLRIADGSGLSRYNLVTADALVAILDRVFRDDRLRDPFVDALPAAGRDGTLETRMRGTPAEGNARAKTGSMSNIRTMAGYVHTADREPLAFAILANGVIEPELAEQAIDGIVVALAGFSRQPR